MINMTVGDLKAILNELPGDMSIIIPVIDEDDANNIFAFRHVRTAGILYDEYEERKAIDEAVNVLEKQIYKIRRKTR